LRTSSWAREDAELDFLEISREVGGSDILFVCFVLAGIYCHQRLSKRKRPVMKNGGLALSLLAMTRQNFSTACAKIASIPFKAFFPS
jgi:hypothetical protein